MSLSTLSALSTLSLFATITTIKTFPFSLAETLYPFSTSSPPPRNPKLLATIMLLCFYEFDSSIYLIQVGSYNICLFVTYFTEQNVLKIHPCFSMCWNFFPCYGCIVFHSTYINLLIHCFLLLGLIPPITALSKLAPQWMLLLPGLVLWKPCLLQGWAWVAWGSAQSFPTFRDCLHSGPVHLSLHPGSTALLYLRLGYHFHLWDIINDPSR